MPGAPAVLAPFAWLAYAINTGDVGPDPVAQITHHTGIWALRFLLLSMAITPLRRVTTPEEFADAIVFFASPWARAITGQNLVVDGGLVKD